MQLAGVEQYDYSEQQIGDQQLIGLWSTLWATCGLPVGYPAVLVAWAVVLHYCGQEVLHHRFVIWHLL